MQIRTQRLNVLPLGDHGVYEHPDTMTDFHQAQTDMSGPIMGQYREEFGVQTYFPPTVEGHNGTTLCTMLTYDVLSDRILRLFGMCIPFIQNNIGVVHVYF